MRKKLYEGGKEAVDAANDPMIVLAKLVDAEARAVRKAFETQVDEPKRQAYAQIAKAKFAVDGDQHLPRRDVHAAAGVRHGQGLRGGRQEGAAVHRPSPACTSAAKEHGNKPPFDLPQRW